MLLLFQTMISDLTAFSLANASLLDEASAAAEAMIMLKNINKAKKGITNPTFIIDCHCHPHIILM